MKKKLALSCMLLALSATTFPVFSPAHAVETSAAASADETAFQTFVDRYFDAEFAYNPEEASSLGFHEYDGKLQDWSKAAISARISQLKKFDQELSQIKEPSLSPRSRIDRALIASHIKASLLDLETVKPFETNPDKYSSGASSVIYVLMQRDYSPLEDRLKSAIEREKQIPNLLAQARENLKAPPKVFTEVALEQLPGIIDFFKTSVTEKFKSVKDEELTASFKDSNDKVIAALSEYKDYLEKTVLPKSTGSFALGSDTYAKKVASEEMVDVPLDKLLARGEAELTRLQKEFIETSKKMDAGKDPRALFETISAEHCKPQELLTSVAGVLKQLRDKCVNDNIVTIPFDDELKVEETPPFNRALSFASMDTPGTFEKKKLDSFYYVTVPEADWKPERVEEHMRAFCTYDLLNTSVHEAFPGHFVQGLWDRKAPSKTAKILGCGSNIEGWAHYCEEMMVDEGLSNNDPKLKLVQIHDALLRVCRYIVGIKMHTQGMTIDQGCAFFEKEGYQEKANALRETKRGTMDPTYLVYTLGKLQILSLRNDYKAVKGKDYSLKDFHDQFLACGPMPVKMIRRVMLGEQGSQTAEGI